MDFRNKNYYLIGRDCWNSDVPKKLKRYFKCKMHCHIYRYNKDIYTHCVSIDKNNSKHMVNYLKDNNIPYVQVFGQFERVNDYTFDYISEEEKNRREEEKREVKRLFSLFNYLEKENKKNIETTTTQTNFSKEEFIKGIKEALDKIYKIAYINPKTYNKLKNELEYIKKECFIEKFIQSEHVDEDRILLIPKKEGLSIKFIKDNEVNFNVGIWKV